MHTFKELAEDFSEKFNMVHFPGAPYTLYEPANYFLSLGGKRIRPVMCLMGNELFDTINPDAWHVAMGIELFHNFTLAHDDIMDKALLRRGMQTLHTKYNENTALLAGDVMLIQAYEAMNKMESTYMHRILALFNRTAKQVCEGQQLDMDFEKKDNVSLEEYLQMVELKTSVLLAASVQMGAILGGATRGNCDHLYAFGLNLGIAFQIQDDFLDAFGDPGKFGKDVGGDIRQNKKTFLLLRALEVADSQRKKELLDLMEQNPADKVPRVLDIFRACKVDEWARSFQQQYVDKAFYHLEAIAVVSARKKPLMELEQFLIQRDC